MGLQRWLAVVAANSAEEAFKTFFEDEDYDWMVEKYDASTYEYTDDFTKWRSDYYPIEQWFECKVLQSAKVSGNGVHRQKMYL